MARVALSACIGVVLASSATAATWGEALLETRSHDFGSVVRGPILLHPFRLTNVTSYPIRVAAVRVSCGCTSAVAEQSQLSPGQATDILVQMDTRRFIGPKTVTVFVTLTGARSPQNQEWDEVRLTVSANARDDLAIVPESLAFGTVPHGSTASKSATVTLRGLSVRLVSVQAETNYVQLAAKGVRNSGSELVYEVTATLRPDTPVGKWYTDIWLNTDSSTTPRIRLPLSVDIAPPLRFSASTLAFGTIRPGESVQKRVLLRAEQPFRITSILGGDDAVSAWAADDAKPVHVIVVAIKGQNFGELSRMLKIVTDRPVDHVAELPITATIALPHVD